MNLKFPLLLSGLVTLAFSLSAQTAQFTDHSVEAGILGDYLNHTLSVADYDLDGDLDVYVGSRLAPNTLYRNEGNEVFVAVEAGVEDESFTMASLFFDYDNDGDPDLLSCNAGDANRFWRNDGGAFTEITEDLGIGTEAQWETATNGLASALQSYGKDYVLNEGDGGRHVA